MGNINDKLSEIVITYYSDFQGFHEDILHTQEVASYTRIIASGEKMSDQEVSLLESAAWLHDIGCPVSKQRYGNSKPDNQQKVGMEVTEQLLRDFDEFTEQQKEWLTKVVGSHHNLKSATELCFEPLYEADLIVNILSGYYAPELAPKLFKTSVKTETGTKLFKTLIKE